MTVGYATLYGDGAGFLAATADLWKHQVYDLARYLNTEVFGREVVPQGSIDIIPSAELSAAQDITKGQGDPLIYPYHDYLFSSLSNVGKEPHPKRFCVGMTKELWKKTCIRPYVLPTSFRGRPNSLPTWNAGGTFFPALLSPREFSHRPCWQSAEELRQ